MKRGIFEDFLEEIIREFELPDCNTCVLVKLMARKIRKKSSEEARLILYSLPERLKECVEIYILDLYLEPFSFREEIEGNLFCFN